MVILKLIIGDHLSKEALSRYLCVQATVLRATLLLVDGVVARWSISSYVSISFEIAKNPILWTHDDVWICVRADVKVALATLKCHWGPCA